MSAMTQVLSAFCCTFGCLFHGFAPDVSGLYLASVVLALGAVNFWTGIGAVAAVCQVVYSKKRLWFQCGLIIKGALPSLETTAVLGEKQAPLCW